MAAKVGKKAAQSAADNPGAVVLVAIIGLVVIGNALGKASAPLKRAGELIGDATREAGDFLQPSSSFDVTDLFPSPRPLDYERAIDESQAFLGGVFIGEDDDVLPIEQRYYYGVPVPTPQPIYQDATDAGSAVRNFIAKLDNWSTYLPGVS